MVGSIDPRCETVSGTHWPKEGRVFVWSSRRGNHLGQRSKVPHQQAGHMDASDPIRPSKKLLWHGGRPHMGPRFSRGRRWSCLPLRAQLRPVEEQAKCALEMMALPVTMADE